MRHLAPRALLVLSGITTFASPSWAATFPFTHCNVSSLCSSVTVTTILNAGAVDVTVFAEPGIGIFGDRGANRAFAFNVVGADAGITITNVSAGFSYAGAGLNVGGPFGAFEFALNGSHTGHGASLPLQFSLIRPGGFSSSEVFSANDDGFLFTAHLRNRSEDVGLSGWAAARGAIAEPPAENVIVNPEPASLLLLGTGLGSFLVMVRRLRPARPHR